MTSLADLHLGRWLGADVTASDGLGFRRRLEVLTDAGLLDDDEAEVWRKRFSAVNSGLAEQSPKLRRRALDHVRTTSSLNALASYEMLGLLSHEQLEAELKRLRPEIDERFKLPSVGVDGERVGSFVRTIAGPADRIGGLRVTTVELFESAVAINWHFDPGLASGPDGALVRRLVASDGFEVDWPDDPLIDLRDPQGPDYAPLLEGGDPTGGGEWIGSHVFTPGVPSSVTCLPLTIANRTFTVPLNG